MRVHTVGKLIPIEGGDDSGIDGALFKGIVQTTWRSRSAMGRRDTCVLIPIPQ
jgi:hypothetical protein